MTAFSGLGAICQRQAHPPAGNGAYGQGVSSEEVPCDPGADRHGSRANPVRTRRGAGHGGAVNRNLRR